MTGSLRAKFLGLTIGCARCHNHKFDPILQADYYRMQAIFAGAEIKDIDIATAAEKSAYEEREKQYKARLKPITDQIEEIEKPYRQKIEAEKKAQLDASHAAALSTPKDKRTAAQEVLAKEAQDQIKIAWDEDVGVITSGERGRRSALRRQTHPINLDKPAPPPAAYAVSSVEKDPPTTYILKVGDFHNR